ncbi:MAG: helix-turn-helix domain-containing protein [Anaerolineae bacterium]|nr:helix-turn-helix domain-containing protein [Anaerolineae bacterium]
MHPTRQRIIEFLKEREEATVEELATEVDMTPMAVRYHLNVLQADNLITAPVVRHQKGPGRPQQVYRLTEAADQLFPEDYYSLTSYLLDELNLQLDKNELAEVFSNIARRLASEAPAPRTGQTFEARLDAVIAFLTQKGFVVDWEADGELYKIHTHSCPYRHVVKDHREICSLDRQVIGTMLDVTPIRLACFAQGDDHCTYQVARPIGSRVV